MSCETSAGTDKPYGLERVCRVLEFPRSTIYAQQAWCAAVVVPLFPVRRGPKPKIPDIDLLAAIRADLAASPFVGEGHRKVWARLRILQNIRVSRARILRLMRENQLLSPHRRPQGVPNLHDGTITTDRPNEMWGTDGIRIETVEQGWVWVFSAVDHFDACCVGIHAVKIGNRFAAFMPSGYCSRLRRACWSNSAPPAPMPDVAWPCAWIMAPNTRPTISSTRSSSGVSLRASPTSLSHRPTVSPNASTAR